MSVGPEIVAAEVGKAIAQQNWFKTMTFGQFVICVFLAAFLGGAYYGITAVVPTHLAQIQAGYNSIHESNAEAVKALASQNAEATKSLAGESAAAVKAVAEKNADNIRLMIDHAESAGLRRERESERTEKFLREFLAPARADEKAPAPAKVGAAEPVQAGAPGIL